MNNIATIILNRNLKDATNNLCNHLIKFDCKREDIFVVEAGSDEDKISSFCTWHVTDGNVIKNGLRYNRGMNYALLELYKTREIWDKYDAFFLLTNDTELYDTNSLEKLKSVLNEHPKVGILSPCGKRWGERKLLNNLSTKYFWFIDNNALLLRKKFIESIMQIDNPSIMNFVFDGSNFRGFLSESEMIAKAYANDWSAAITTEVFAEENQSYLLDKAELIRTEDYNENYKLYIEEGKTWARNKYGFNSRWTMNQYVKFFYEDFFKFNEELLKFKL